MRVHSLHIITDLDCGGAEQMLVRLCSMQATMSIAVLSLKTPGVFKADLETLGVPVYTLNMQYPVLNPKQLFALYQIIRTLQPRVYWGWMYHGALVATIARFFYRACLVWNFRQTLEALSSEALNTRLVIYILRLLQWIPDRIIYNAVTALESHRALGFTAASHVIPNGFSDADFFKSDAIRTQARNTYGLPAGALVIGHAARNHPMKGHHFFFEAVLPLLEEHENLWILCCGSGVDSRLLPKGFPSDRVLFLGVELQMNSFYNAIDIFCSSSICCEGFSNVLAEALLVGLPCVATNVGAAASFVPACSGLVVAPRSVSQLHTALSSMLIGLGVENVTSIEQRRAFMQQHYSLQAVTRKFQEVEAVLLA